ncbi:3-oxoacyl-ACP reductase FabG [Bacillus sp. JJ1521]|uniref:SDR family NAD(P)-dependent oxidoreductase n=1 Tax=Bacillus sp. JJ1521 TaxID=3122957 RepID=UPI003000EA93
MVDQKKSVAFVTGGSRGIGKACALALAEEGHDLAISYLQDKQSAIQIESEVKKLGRNIRIYQADMRDPDQVIHLSENVLKDFGRVDVLVHNAGVGSKTSFAELTSEEWNQCIEVNLNSAYHLLKSILPKMQIQRNGKVILMGSLSSRIGGVVNAAYAASKGGLVSMAKYLVQEYGPFNININVVGPGLVETDLFKSLNSKEDLNPIAETIPMKRFAQTSEIASVVKFLASDAASYINGETIYISGGR